MIVYVNPMQIQSPNLHKLTIMQFKRSIRKTSTSFLVQLIGIGDDVETTSGTTLCHNVGKIC